MDNPIVIVVVFALFILVVAGVLLYIAYSLFKHMDEINKHNERH